MFNTTLKDSGQRQIVVNPMGTDKRGNPAPLDGPPVFASADTSIATFETDPSDPTGFTGLLKAVGPLATAAAVTITADGKLGTGTFEIIENGLVEITAGDATSLGVAVGDETEQP